MESPARTALLVLGMHRSGTSALTRVLGLLGSALPKQLIEADTNNQSGYWEPATLNNLHNRMLAEAGSSWDDWRAFDPDGRLSPSRLAYYKEKLRSLIAEEYGDAPLFVVKDPRICRFAPLFETILTEQGVVPRYLLPCRNPLAVIASLEKRDGMTPGFAGLLWLRHVLDAEVATRGRPRAFLSYEDFLDDWRGTMQRVTATLGLAWPHPIEEAIGAIDDYLSHDLQHHTPTVADLEQEPEIAGWVKEAYAALTRLSSLENDTDAIAVLDRIGAEFGAVAPIFGAAAFPELAVREQRFEVARRIFQSQAGSQEAEIHRLSESNANKALEIEKASTELREEKQKADRLSSKLGESERRIDTLISEFSQERAALLDQLKAVTEDRDHARSEEKRLHDVLDAVYASTSWRISAPVRSLSYGLRALTNTPRITRSFMSRRAYSVWYGLPLPVESKRKLKNALFGNLPFLFRSTRAYRAWKDFAASSTQFSSVQRHDASAGFPPVEDGEERGSAAEYVPLLDAAPLTERAARVIAFYLPQFHPIAENDAWWGEGFTEWTNVRPAEPQFVGHYQPHVPADLGYYDLRDTEVQRKQIELAKLYGIEGFSFYFYWFAGKRLLETPVENYLDDKSLDLPFCLCWANENWSRRWDGLDSEILIAQEHSAEDDIAFISHVARYLRDPRYIRVEGKPLLIVYRPSLLPSASETARRWRQWCRENGVGEIFLAYTQSFENADPGNYGFDAAIEFPPNNSAPPNVTNEIVPLHENFACTIYDWSVFVERSKNFKSPDYTLFRSVCPSWDNTARRGNKATVFINNTPELYGAWLRNVVADTKKRFSDPDKRLIFVNAWNEWAEGAHLEPDERSGYAYLAATRQALEPNSTPQKRRVVVVSHDAHPHGAQLLAKSIAGTLKDLGFGVDLIVLGDGPLISQFAEVATVHRIDLASERETAVMDRLSKLYVNNAEVAIVNTTVSGLLIPLLHKAGFRTVSLIHELPGILKGYKLENRARAIAAQADAVVFPAQIVQQGFEDFVGQRLAQARVRPQGLYLRSPFDEESRPAVRHDVREKLGLSPQSRIILCVGYGDHRKGLDLFIDACQVVIENDPHAVAVWVGHLDTHFYRRHIKRIREAGLESRFIFTGRVEQPQQFYFAADVYALTSREDPFPSTVMEALDAGIPIVAFQGAGGFEDLLASGCGLLVPAYDTAQMATAIAGLLADPDHAAQLASNGRAVIAREFQFAHYVHDLLAFAGRPLPRVSVIVPNYNYARYIEARLASVAAQTIQPYELIVLDDASTDDSVARIRRFLATSSVPSFLVVNEENSGSVFRQWQRGVEMARGDYVWIAEADDLADPEFLETLLPSFERPDVVMSYCQSRQMDGDGNILCEHYLDYVGDIDTERWTKSYVADGREEIARALFLKNTIPNVSGVIFRREPLLETLTAHAEEILSFRNAGDWVAYLRLLENGAVAFSPRSLNSHRRHQSSVTVGNFDLRHLREIIRVQMATIEKYNLEPSAKLAADAYAQGLYEQFGFSTEAHPRYSDHPELRYAPLATKI